MNVLKATFVPMLTLAMCLTQSAYPFAVAFAEEAESTSVSESGVAETAHEESAENDTDDEGEEGDESDTHEASKEGEEEEGSTDIEVGSEEIENEEDAIEEEVSEGEEREEGSDDSEGEADASSMSTATSSDALLIEASIESADSATSTTGNATSTASSTENTTIVSGTSIALANVLNLVNSNFVNSEGVVLFSNFFENVVGAIDFREYFANAASFGCSLISCQGEHVAVNIDNNASIDNDILVAAHSGQNTIENGGNGEIRTGDAYAGLNLVNVANTNLVDSSYLLVTLNAFQNINGDIVFPSLSQFFGSLAGGASNVSAIDINSSAAVTNDVHVNADAGGNSAEGNGGSITTGNAVASSNVFNQLNSSLIGGQSVSIVFRVHGAWAGEVFGAPDNLGWTAGDDGSIYLFDTGGGAAGAGNLTIHGTSTAAINNRVNVVALTGENAISGGETAVISTGNAYAGANIVNVANANVVGRNWILAVINIFGDFNGNIAFGRPDTWIGGQIDVPPSIANGSELEYAFTVINNGDSTASNVKLETKLNGDYLDIQEASHDYTEEEGSILWDLGTIPAGGAVEITYAAEVENTEPGTEIIATSQVRQRETDNNMSDNKEILAVSTDRRGGNGVRIELSTAHKETNVPETILREVTLETERMTAQSMVTPANRTIEQKLFLRNNTNATARGVVLHDVLTDPEGNVLRDEIWELGDVLPHEEIELGYLITFKQNALPGAYSLSTQIEGENVSYEEQNGTILFAALALPETPLLSSLVSTSTLPAAASDTKEDTGSEVFFGEETPLIGGTLGTPRAEAANDLLASASGSGFTLDPIIAFFIAASGLLCFSLLRLFRIV